jgi:hypothetical protein
MVEQDDLAEGYLSSFIVGIGDGVFKRIRLTKERGLEILSGWRKGIFPASELPPIPFSGRVNSRIELNAKDNIFFQKAVYSFQGFGEAEFDFAWYDQENRPERIRVIPGN